jgi:hypothetical protein
VSELYKHTPTIKPDEKIWQIRGGINHGTWVVDADHCKEIEAENVALRKANSHLSESVSELIAVIQRGSDDEYTDYYIQKAHDALKASAILKAKGGAA